MFQNRKDAGQQLAQELSAYQGKENVIVLGLPRGGVPVAYEVANELDLPLDVFVVRKLGVSGNPELAMGAIASGDVRVMNDDVVRQARVSEETIRKVLEREKKKLHRREKTYRGARPGLEVKGKTVLLIDDGLATGATMRAAVRALQERNPERIVVAVPTAPPRTCSEFKTLVDEVICLSTPRSFMGVGGSYRSFGQTTNETVQQLLEKANE